jgi:hypothetical protein
MPWVGKAQQSQRPERVSRKAPERWEVVVPVGECSVRPGEALPAGNDSSGEKGRGLPFSGEPLPDRGGRSRPRGNVPSQWTNVPAVWGMFHPSRRMFQRFRGMFRPTGWNIRRFWGMFRPTGWNIRRFWGMFQLSDGTFVQQVGTFPFFGERFPSGDGTLSRCDERVWRSAERPPGGTGGLPTPRGRLSRHPLKGRESSARRSALFSLRFSRPFRPLGDLPTADPGRRPPASALGWNLPARWAGFVRRSWSPGPTGGTVARESATYCF